MHVLFRLTCLIFGLSLCYLFATSTAHAEPFKNNSAFGGEVERHPNQKKGKSCSKYYDCGPTTTLTLTLHATDENASNYDTGENSTLEEMMQRGEDYKNLGPLSMAKQIANARAAHEGPEIHITLPMIDYGYSGTFENIKIKASKGGETLTTAKKDKNGNHLGFTGSVTIEQYAPNVMKGSYSGELYSYDLDEDFRGRAWEPVPFILLATGTVSGEFNILRPWKNDGRVNENIDNQSAMVDPMKEDIKRLANRYGIDIDVDKEFEKVDANKKRNSRSSSTSLDIYDGCNCSCNFTQSATPKCQKNCSEAFDVCKGERYVTPEQKTPIDRTELSQELKEAGQNYTLQEGEKFMNLDQETIDRFEADEVNTPDNLRDKFIALLEQEHPGEKHAPIREMMLQGFDSMPDEKSKMH